MAVLDTFKADNLIADNGHALAGGTVIVASGEGELKRGALLARNASDEFELLDTDATGKAEVILAADVDATSADAVAEVYISGDFFENYLTVDESYTITEADRLNLKNAGIYLIAGLEA